MSDFWKDTRDFAFVVFVAVVICAGLFLAIGYSLSWLCTARGHFRVTVHHADGTVDRYDAHKYQAIDHGVIWIATNDGRALSIREPATVEVLTQAEAKP